MALKSRTKFKQSDRESRGRETGPLLMLRLSISSPHAAGEKQISEYLDYWHLNTGYMLSFNFNQKKEQGVKRIQIGDKVLFEGTV